MNRKCWGLILCLFLGLFLAGTVRGSAQTGAGNIQGTVSDATGAVVPDATVALVQTQTGLKYNTKTNGVGFYVFPPKELGPYRITVQAAGMETWNAELTLQAGQTAEVDAVLKVGAATSQVTVSADVSPLVNTTDATLSNVVEHARIEQLPLNGRNVDTLVYETTPGLTTFKGKVPTVNGVVYGSDFTQDGALLENRDWQRLPDRLPGLDTIDEFQVQTSNADAKAERPGTVTLTTRHGTNQLHGSLFETNRDNSYGLARARQDVFSGFKSPHLVRNEFGGSVGGPVDIPKVYNGRDKTFFFFAYEGYRRRQAGTGAATVPTAAMRNGDFSGLVNDAGQAITLYNPYTSTSAPTWMRQAFPKNQIDPSLESPLAKYLYSVTPMPTLPSVNPLVDNNWFGLGTDNQNQYTSTLRFDHQFSQKDQVFFRYSHGTNTELVFNNGINGNVWPSTTDGFFNVYAPKGHNDTGVVSWTHTYSPTFFGETLFTYARDYHIEGPGSGIENIASKLGLPNPFNAGTPPDIVDVGFSNFNYQCGCYLNRAWARVIDIGENLTRTVGRHELFFGGKLRMEHDTTLPDQQYQSGYEDFASLATSLYDPSSGSAYNPLPLTGSDAANFFTGVAWYQAFANRQAYRNQVNEKMLYFQDNFKVNHRLTLNLGVRWEYNPPLHLADNSLVGFDPAKNAVVLQSSLETLQRLGDVVPAIAAGYAALSHCSSITGVCENGVKYETAAQAGLPSNLVFSNKHDFVPRLGFAYRLTQGKHYSVLRGGYGRYYYPDSLRLWNGNNQFTVPNFGNLESNPNLGQQSPDGIPSYLLRAAPPIIAGQNSQNALPLNAVANLYPGTGTVFWVDPHAPTSHADQWNLTFQKEVSADTALSLTYVGTHGANSPQYYSVNDVPSNFAWYINTGQQVPNDSIDQQPFDQLFGTMQEYRKTGWSNDNSFQVQLQHQYSKGYAFQVFYVLSNAFRAGGDGWRPGGDYVFAPNLFLPGMLPSNYHAADRLLNYQRDNFIPQHQIKWNWIANLPFGRGKSIGGNANRFLNAVIGGWQLAGAGTWYSRFFSLPTGLYGDFSGAQIYGNHHQVLDCRSGECVGGDLYWNGYIPANLVNQGSNGVYGVPSNYQPFQTPLLPTPASGVSAGDPLANYYGTNSVCVNLAAKTYQTLTANSPCLAGTQGYVLTSANLDMPWPLNRWNPRSSNKWLRGPNEWNMDASLFKEFPISERARLRFNMDFFNVFNHPGQSMNGISSGIITKRVSDNLPRVMQLTLRLNW